jgi:competence protein ComEC
MTPLIRAGIAWLTGIALARWFNIPWQLTALPIIPLAAGLFLYRNNPRGRMWAGVGVMVCAGMFRLQFFQPVIDENHIAFYNDNPTPVKITGLVADEPDVRDNYINLRVQTETIAVGDSVRPVEGLMLVRAPRYPAHAYGDRLEIRGKLETPPVFEDFSYKDYLARFGIHAMMRRGQINLIESEQGAPFWAAMLTFKANASTIINRVLPEPHASLLNGILLGIETGIPRGLYEQFNLTGTSHIIVISGSNISLVAAIFLLLGKKVVGKRIAPALAIGGIVVYTFLVGADAAVSRAAVMGIIWALSIWVGRPGLALNSLMGSAVVLTALNPLIVWDVGFQLSFMATLGLIVLVPPLERLTFGLLKRWLHTERVGLAMALLNELLIITLAAQIITGPLIVYHFGRLSLVSILTNLLILPVQPPIMILGALTALLGMLWLPLAQFAGWLTWLPLAWSVGMVELTAPLPFASLDLGRLPWSVMALMYVVLAAVVWRVNTVYAEADKTPHFRLPAWGSTKTRLWLAGAAASALLAWLAVASLPDGRLHVAFLDVGQGDAILITLPDGQQMLIDGGPSATELNWRLGQQMPFWDRTLEMVVNTHPDADHLAGLVSLFDRYRVEQALTSDVGARSQLYKEWEMSLAQAEIAATVGQAGTKLALGPEIVATIISPGPSATVFDDANNHSVVIRLEYGQISFLLPGDIEAPVEAGLVATDMPLKSTVLKSPHHGSNTSSSEAFLAAVNPQAVVISVGADNHFGHPAPKVEARYAEFGVPVLRTDQRGTIEFITDGQHLWVETSR